MAGDGMLHDDHIVGYNVNFEAKSVVIQTYNTVQKKQRKICFSEVLTHSFKCSIEFNIILDLYEREINKFVRDNQEELMKMEGCCWPVDYDTEQELIAFLTVNEYRYIKIDSSYGMSGWILAKSYWLEE